jgi:hypothetical protein
MKFSQYIVASIALVGTLQIGAVCRCGVCYRGGLCRRVPAAVKRVISKRAATPRCYGTRPASCRACLGHAVPVKVRRGFVQRVPVCRSRACRRHS